MLNANNQAIAHLELQIGQLTSAVSERENGTFPSQPMSNPRTQNLNQKANQARMRQDDQVKVITTLRSVNRLTARCHA